MKQVTVFGIFCLLPVFVTQNGCTKKEPPSAGNESTNETSSQSHQPEQGDVITNSIGMRLVYIPAGSFMMGSGDSAAQLAKEYDEEEADFADEFPRHQVRISEGFWMSQTEVTQGQYKSVMKTQPWSRYPLVEKSANNPAVWVTWDDAAAFCRELSQQEGKTYRLPTEAEWEYACRAGTTTRFSFGDSDIAVGDYAWYRSNAFEGGQKYGNSVGQKRPNPWDLYDMHGNVFEWCSDCYDKDYYSNSPSVDPKGPLSEVSRPHTLRGGSWPYGESYLRCSERFGSGSINRCNFVGFRVVGYQLEPDLVPERPEVAMEEPDEAVANSIGMRLVYVPAGSFMMGSNDHKIESPPHEVHISESFWMGQTEVTQGQYESVMNAQPWSGQKEVQESPNNPAVYVRWNDAVEFCRKLSQREGKTYRLPTEAEWEYACRAGTKTRFSFGDSNSSLGDYAWYGSNTWLVDQMYAHPVGQKKPNPWGLYDTHGNVYEWCSDWYDTDYYSNSPTVDPNGPSSGDARCLRGGSWRLDGNLHCSCRYATLPFGRLSNVGFRVVLSQR